MVEVVTFGEIMLRLSPPGFQRFLQADTFEAIYGGAEASVAISLANFGVPPAFVTCLPSNEIGQAAINYLRRFGVDTSHVVRGGERVGIYFLETGANQRPSKVIYDRAHSAISELKPGTISWSEVFAGAKWFHFTGITPALSQSVADVCFEASRIAKERGLMVSCDLNYRSKLWKYGKQPGEVMSQLMRHVDIAIGNEEDCERFFGIKGANVEKAEEVSSERYMEVAEKMMKRFPHLQKICTTLRGSISASHNTWTAVLYDGKRLYTTSTFDITDIVDRVGGGDAFAAGLIYSFIKGRSNQEALDFATAASTLKHSILYDNNLVTVEEVENLMKKGGSGRVQR
jgi:2-dehydro-3-deoxygluconokinase